MPLVAGLQALVLASPACAICKSCHCPGPSASSLTQQACHPPWFPPAGVVLTNWVDVIKVRQQLAGPQARNLAATCWQVVRGEGLLALQRGIVPAVARGVLYGGAL